MREFPLGAQITMPKKQKGGVIPIAASIAKLSWLLNAFPDTPPNICRHNSLLASKLPSVQPGVAKSLIYLFLKQPQDKEHFITELLDFGTI